MLGGGNVMAETGTSRELRRKKARRLIARMKKGYDLGLKNGKAYESRDEIYDDRV